MAQKFMLIFHGGSYNGLSPEEAQKMTQKWYSTCRKTIPTFTSAARWRFAR